MKKKLKKIYVDFLSWRQLVWRSKAEFPYTFFQKLKWALRGFSINEVNWYDLEHKDYHTYISELERQKTRGVNGDYKFILDNKLVFEEVLSNHVRVPKNYAYVSNGHIYSLHGFAVNNETICDFVRQVGKCVLKYLGSGGGHGVYVLEGHADGSLTMNGEKATEEDVKAVFSRKGESLLCEYMRQSNFLASLYPHSANTIRIICAKKKGQAKAKVLYAVQRMGCDDSIPVDNFSSGGLVSHIDLETGELGAAIRGHGPNQKVVFYDKHPDTGAQIKGKTIPDWKELCLNIEEVTNAFPYINFVAWDVLLIEQEENPSFSVIEGNASSSTDLLQIQSPGLKNTFYGEVLSSYGYLKKRGGYCIIEGNASSGCTVLQIVRDGLKYTDYGDLLRSYGYL